MLIKIFKKARHYLKSSTIRWATGAVLFSVFPASAELAMIWEIIDPLLKTKLDDSMPYAQVIAGAMGINAIRHRVNIKTSL